MLKLNAGFSRKIGEPDYGSRGASVNLELEVESNLVNDPDGLTDRIRKLFHLARQAVDQELNGATPPTRGPTRSNGDSPTPPRTATASQLRAIRSIAERLQLDAERLATDAYNTGLNGLTLKQASQLIDELKARNGNGAHR